MAKELIFQKILQIEGTDAYLAKAKQVDDFVKGPGSTNPQVIAIRNQMTGTARAYSFYLSFIGGSAQTVADQAASDLVNLASALQAPAVGFEAGLAYGKWMFRFYDELRKIEDPDLVLVGSMGEL